MSNKYYEIARQYQREEEKLKKAGFSGNLRVELAKRLGMSVSNSDRYSMFNKLHPDLQTLVRDYDVGISSLQKTSSHSIFEQKEIYEILKDAHTDGVQLTRDAISQIIDHYRNALKTWLEIKPLCTLSFGEPHPHTPKKENSIASCLLDLRAMNGTEFEVWVAELLKKLGFAIAETTKPSHDGGRDIRARYNDLNYVFQCKNVNTVKVGAFHEVWFAKEVSDHFAVVVTPGKIAKTARNAAETRGILCWDGETLLQLIERAESGTSKCHLPGEPYSR